MLLDLEKQDIINLIRGTYPKWEQIAKFEKLGLGNYTGGFVDKWNWNETRGKCWDKLSEGELYKLYQELC